MTALERAALAREIARVARANAAGPACACGPQEPAANPGGRTRLPLSADLARLVSYALSDPGASEAEVRRVVQEAQAASCHAVLVQPCWASLAVRLLAGRGPRVASLVGFPHGASLTPVKCLEAETLLRLGVEELEMVINVGALRSGDLDTAYLDIRAVAQVAQCRGASLGVALELPRLTAPQRVEACAIAKLAGADYAITATGWDGAAAAPADVALMRRAVGGQLGISAAGGIQALADVRKVLEAGATRLATGRGLEILREASH